MFIQKQIRKIKYLLRALMYFGEKTPKQIIDGAQHKTTPPVREGPQSSQKRIELLQQKIDHIKNPEDLQGILRILQKYVPNLLLSQEMVIEGRLISKACANELKEFFTEINI